MQWRRRRKIGGWCLLTRWQNHRNQFSKKFPSCGWNWRQWWWIWWRYLLLGRCGPPVGEDEAEGEGHHRHRRFSHRWPSWCWRWHCKMRTMMTWQKMFLHLLEIHDLYLCKFVCVYFLYIFICICVHACLYFLYIFSWVDSLPCGAMAGSKREGRWERFRITKLSSIESSTSWERFDSKYKIFS